MYDSHFVDVWMKNSIHEAYKTLFIINYNKSEVIIIFFFLNSYIIHNSRLNDLSHEISYVHFWLR
jgi:hypothetical protein